MYLFDEARGVAAAVDPKLLAENPGAGFDMHQRHATIHIVHTMLTHGHGDAAFDCVLAQDPAPFPFDIVGNVLQQLDPNNPEAAARRMVLFHRAAEVWSLDSIGQHPHERNSFVRLFGHFWKEFPPEQALYLTRMIVARAAEDPDTGTSASYSNEVRFASPRQNTLFQILHVLRHLDPALAQSLIDSHDQIAAGARRYPNGLQTMHEEAEKEAARRRADGANCEGGYCLAGDPRDFGHQRRLIDAFRSGDFGPAIEDSIEKYREDTSPETRTYAPKEYWPSTGAFRTLFYQAVKRLGPEAATLLNQIPDDDLRLFSAIELAAALSGAPASSITSRTQRHPLGSPELRGGRIVAAWSSCGPQGQ